MPSAMVVCRGTDRSSGARHRAEGAEVRVPRDVAELDDDAQLEVGPERIVALRPRKLRTASLVKAAAVGPLDDARRLRHARGALTEQ
jgi:hypothetical protein